MHTDYCMCHLCLFNGTEVKFHFDVHVKLTIIESHSTFKI